VSWLRPHPHRGDVIAAGAVPLAIAALAIDLRMTQWSVGARFVVVGLIATLLLVMGWLAELEGEAPRAYHSVLLVAGLLPGAIALVLLAELFGAAHPPGPGGYVWTLSVVVILAASAARHANSAICTLIAALVGAGVVFEFVAWVFQPQGLSTYRALILAIALSYTAAALGLRERHRRHSVQFVNAAGLVTAALALTYAKAVVVEGAIGWAGLGGLTPSAAIAPFGWKLYLLAAGLGLVAYACVDREPGPAYIGAIVLIAFGVLVGLPTSSRGSLVGWPLLLLVIGGAAVAIGLRPREPLPPEPSSAAGTPPTEPPPPTVPLRPVDHE
jgi:hypothetical protein